MRYGAFVFAVSTILFLGLTGTAIADVAHASRLSVALADTCSAIEPAVVAQAFATSQLDVGRNGAPFPFTFTLRPTGAASGTYPVGFDARHTLPDGSVSEVERVQLGTRDIGSEFSIDTSWQVPTYAPAGGYTITPYIETPATVRTTSTTLSFAIVSDAGERAYVTAQNPTSSHLLETDVKEIEYGFNLVNPSTEERQLRLRWDVSEAVLADVPKSEVAESLVTLAPGETKPLSRHLDRSGYYALHVALTATDMDFSTTAVSDLPGLRQNPGQYIVTDYSTTSLLGIPHYVVTGCFSGSNLTDSSKPVMATLGKRTAASVLGDGQRRLSLSWTSLWTSPPSEPVRLSAEGSATTSLPLSAPLRRDVLGLRVAYVAVTLAALGLAAYSGRALILSRKRYLPKP